MKGPSNPLRLLLDRIRADKIAPIGIDEYVQVDTLLLRCPELRRSEAREELRYALASLLATDSDQWNKIWHLSHEFLAGDQAPHIVAPIVRRETLTARPQLTPISLATRAVIAVADLPRSILLFAAALVVIGIAVLILHIAGVRHPEAVPPRPPVERESLMPPSQWRTVPLGQQEERIDVPVPQQARELDAGDLCVFAISAVLLTVGACWLLLPRRNRELRRKRAKENAEGGLQLRREMSREAERNNVSRRLIYHVVRVPPMREDTAADTATILGRLFGRVQGTTLDLDRTIEATVTEGGRFVPVRTERRVARTLTLLVDVEGGSHPWLNDIQWLLDRWQALGVRLQRYDFHFEPLFLTDATSGLPILLEKLARRAEGEPLVIISRKLTGQQFRGEARWLRHAEAWQLRAWLDPSPRQDEELPAAYRTEVERLARRGFRRFPFTEEGLVALANYLISEGQGIVAPERPELPPLSDPEVTRAVEKWALFASLVPDATWEQLQAVRESFPEIRAVLPENRHLQRLLDWAELRNENGRAESSDGNCLELNPALVDDLILRFRTAECVLPEAQRLEARCRQLLLTQLGATEPDDPLMRQFWQLKRMRHQLALDPDKARFLLPSLIAGPWHNEAIESVKTELDRDNVVKTLPRATRDGFRMAAESDNNRLRIGDLVRLPLALIAASAGVVLVLGILTAIMFKRIPNVSGTLLSASYNFEGILPRDSRIEAISSTALSEQQPTRGMLWLQQSLNKLGADPRLAEDGIAGPITMATVSQFQSANGLEVTGFADGATVAAIERKLRLMPDARLAAEVEAKRKASAEAAADAEKRRAEQAEQYQFAAAAEAKHRAALAKAEAERQAAAKAEAEWRKQGAAAQARSSALVSQSNTEINIAEYARAIATASEAIRLDPRYTPAFHARGLAYMYKGDLDRAIADYNEAIRLDPRYASAFAGRGATYRFKGDFDRAIADYNEAIRLDPKNAAAFANRGAAYDSKGDYGRAIADYTQSILLDPKDSQAWCWRGKAKLKINDRTGNADIATARKLDASFCK